MNQEIIQKYSVPVPRYTSYPPANYFNDSFTAESYREAVIASNDASPQHISIYIHIPFCFRMCYYCGCNAMLLRSPASVEAYREALKKEMRLVLPLLSHGRKISQIHYGGGTPTSQPASFLQELNEIVLSEFDCIDQPEIAIECHPGYMDETYWKTLPDIGFNRVSIGIQDFKEEVLRTPRRKGSRLPLEDIVGWLREKQVSVNFDFIYGLPLQTRESFSESIRHAVDIQPDRIVTFSYAHVPWVNPLQKKLEVAGLPGPVLKSNLFDDAASILTHAGYKAIGMDHFVLPDDELYHALQEKTLARNFQGYCTRHTTGQVYAFGVTGISQLSNSYSQNVKDLDTYISMVNAGRLPVLKGYSLNREEQLAREVISTLMCNYSVNWEEVASSAGVPVGQVKQAIHYDEQVLKAFADDGILVFDETAIHVLPEAAPFVRNVAAALDKLMLHSDKKFSKSL
ncbi:MAG TPA: oxygen-independent coproporphyrinogen III oxidase [Porphyromonadaceae bacterium]|nr:oxygen-independent coproporphyrinogen III oxidase [Porphyromonadaceae bacterium]